MRSFKTLLFAAVMAGCTGTGSVQYAATADISPPELVEIEPGIQVVADYDEPVFYREGVYWRYDEGTWYRSEYYNRGWIRIETPPVVIRQIQHPEAYVHFHAHAGDRREREARAYPPPAAPVRPVTPEVRTPPPAPAPLPPSDGREHRGDRHDEREGPPGPPVTSPGQDVRDDRHDAKAEHRDDRRDEKIDRRDEKRDDKAERRDEKRDDKAEKRDEKRDDKAEKRDDKHDHKHH